jgi:hypothetical protein
MKSRNARPGITTTVLDPAMTKADLDQVVEKSSGCGQIIAAAYVSVSAYRGNVALAGGYPDFLNALIAGKRLCCWPPSEIPTWCAASPT